MFLSPCIRSFRRSFLLAVAAALPAAPLAQAPRSTRFLPPEVEQVLQRERIPLEAMSVVVQEAGSATPRINHNARVAVNPASIDKLLTTFAALDLLGPAFTWNTPVWLQGTVRDGVLDGSVFIKGSGDPKLVLERVWLLLRRIQQMGVREIRGDIVLDRSAFTVPEAHPADFDNEPLRPYNVRPTALLLNLRSVVYTFTPDAARGLASVSAEPALAGVSVDSTVPLSSAPCEDWRGALKPGFEAARVRFAGSFSASCGERAWPLAYPDPKSYDTRLVEAVWLELGGKLTGTVRDGPAPVGAKPSFELVSPQLAEVVRDINKFSNNVMAQQLFLTLGLQRKGLGTFAASRELMRDWLAERYGDLANEVVVDNGSGLSRSSRVSAALLARVLQSAWGSPVMPELMASLPVNGLDGTLRRSRAPAGRAHLKTGSLRDVAGVAGYVLAGSGRRYVLVALINHPNANAARPALDALVQWTLDDARFDKLHPKSPE